jgi:hypothetical protein
MARLGHARYLTCYLFAAERHQTLRVAFFSDYHHKQPHPHRQRYPTFLKIMADTPVQPVAGPSNSSWLPAKSWRHFVAGG